MSMTEQEIRADERKKVATTLTVLRPFLKDAESVGVSFAIKFLTGVRPEPEPEPKVTYKVTWGAYDAKGNFRPEPPKDWRDVPVTAGMLVSVCNMACRPGEVYAAGQLVERVAKQMVAP